MPSDLPNSEELTDFIDAKIMREARGVLRSLVRDAACKVGLVTLQRDEVVGNDGPVARELTRRIEKISVEFANEFCNTLRRGSDDHRFLVLDDVLYAILRDTLRNRAAVWTNRLVEKHAPEKAASTFDTMNWPKLLSQSERAAIESDLRYPRWIRRDVDEAYVDFIITVSWLSCVQLLVVGTRVASSGDHDGGHPFRDLFINLLPANEFDTEVVSSEVASIFDRLRDRASEALPSTLGSAIHGRTEGMLLTGPMPWSSFCIHLREHLSDDLTRGLPGAEPSWWGQLCDDSDQLLVLADFAQLNHGPSLTEHRLRELSGLAECLRASQPAELRSSESVGCRAFAIILGEPWADGRPPFEGMQVPRSEFGHEFRVSKVPFTDVQDLGRLEGRGFRLAYAWLRSGVKSALVLRRALDCYITASNLGGRYGSISPIFEGAWRTAALWTCLEVLFCEPDLRTSRKIVVDERVEAALPRLSSSATESAQRVAIVRKAYNYRNDAVHAAGRGLEDKDLQLFSDTVRILLGDAIKTAAAR
jgi:hypothetical protein